MKKLLLSSAVMLFLCSVGFAQVNKAVLPSKAANRIAAQKAQKDLEEKKLKDYQAAQANGFKKTEAQILANKQTVEGTIAEMKAQKASASLVDPRSN